MATHHTIVKFQHVLDHDANVNPVRHSGWGKSGLIRLWHSFGHLHAIAYLPKQSSWQTTGILT